jgi:hypothetical protein
MCSTYVTGTKAMYIGAAAMTIAPEGLTLRFRVLVEFCNISIRTLCFPVFVDQIRYVKNRTVEVLTCRCRRPPALPALSCLPYLSLLVFAPIYSLVGEDRSRRVFVKKKRRS